MSVYHLDYETRSRADLKKYGAYRYASDVSTSILLAAICKEDGPIEIWDCSATKEENAAARALLQEVSDDANTVIFAHNAPFELAITAYGWKRAFGFKPPEIEQWRCTAALCRTAAIPYSLKDAAEFLGLEEQKDTAGAALIRKFSLPKKDGEWTEPAADKKAWESFREYCRKDVEVERQIHKRLQALDLKGWVLDSFQMDLRMNHRGVPINVPGVIEAEKLVKGYNDRMWEEFTNFTGLLPTQTARSLEWFQAEGYPEKDLRSATITKVLTGEIITEEGDDTGEVVQPGWSKMTEHGVKALKLRALLSFAALKKLPTMRNAVCPDNRVRGVLMWHGASRTGRHSSRILQVQNMRRPTVKNTERIYAEICSGKIDALDLEVEHGPPLECVASCIRHFIDPGEGKQFIDVDFSQIEARTLAWLAGHKALLQAFHDGKDLYKQTASMTFGVPYDEVDKDLRFLGKVVSLACGYQGGTNAFQIMAKNYGTEVTEEKAVEVVKAFRANNTPIVNLWKAMQASAIEAIRNPGRWVAVNSLIRFGLTNALGYPSLVMELPSKRRIQYPKPSIRTVYKFKNQKTGRWDEISENRALDADGETKEGVWATQEITYAGQMKQSVKWGRVTTHGGVFTENACQAVAGDFLTHGTLNAEKAGYEPCFVVHDQLITNYRPERGETVDGLISALCRIPEWAPGFPLNAVGGLTDFYTKD